MCRFFLQPSFDPNSCRDILYLWTEISGSYYKYEFLQFIKTGHPGHDVDMRIILTSDQNNQQISLKTRLNFIHVVFRTCEEGLEIAEHGTGFRFLVYPAGEYSRCMNTPVFPSFCNDNPFQTGDFQRVDSHPLVVPAGL